MEQRGLVDCFIKHLEACDIPQAVLVLTFQRNFSQKTFSDEEKNQLLASPVPPPVSPSGNLNHEHLNEARTGKLLSCVLNLMAGVQDQPGHQKRTSKIIFHHEHLNEARTGQSPELCSQFDDRANLDINRCKQKNFASHIPNLPLSIICLANLLILKSLPTSSTPRRAMPSSDDKHKASAGQKQTLSRKPVKRVLDFPYLEGDKGASECYEFLHDSSTQILAGSSSLLKKVEGTLEEELEHKIILDSSDIIDRREVGEQIGILEMRVPDWICRIPATSGDVLYKIKKMSRLRHGSGKGYSLGQYIKVS
ncbi:unnamed protein product [Dovyalis caffra]|uniref:Uncharacterized protein n=1 Tax=Dovyalis caffra TaxID=77055 RepID=A0AAV1RIM6_9ROSI|nr:unnamed protein product [Dovyalis caffra]